MLWRPGVRRPVWARPHSDGWTRGVGWLTGGRGLVTATANGLVRAISLETGDEIDSFKTGSLCQGLALAPDDSVAVVAGGAGRMEVWDLGCREPKRKHDTGRGAVVSMRATRGFQRCVLAHEDGTLSVWQYDWQWSS